MIGSALTCENKDTDTRLRSCILHLQLTSAMLIGMATRQSVHEFIALHCVVQTGAAIPMPVFRSLCKRWAFEQGYNPPSSRLITAVLRESGVEPQGSRYDWFYDGIGWAPDKGVAE